MKASASAVTNFACQLGEIAARWGKKPTGGEHRRELIGLAQLCGGAIGATWLPDGQHPSFEMLLCRRSCPLAFVSFRGGAGKRQVSVRIDQTRYRETAHV